MVEFWKSLVPHKRDRKREAEAATIVTKSIKDEMTQTRDNLANLVNQMSKPKEKKNAQS